MTEKITKTFTANDIASKFDCNATTVRSWGRKPIPGEVYDPEKVNTKCIIDQLKKLFTVEELEARFECPIEEVEVIKSLANSNNKTTSVNINDMVEGHYYILYSHVNKFEYKLVKIVSPTTGDVEGLDIMFIFEKLKDFKKGQDKYRVLTYTELNTERWRIREANND